MKHFEKMVQDWHSQPNTATEEEEQDGTAVLFFKSLFAGVLVVAPFVEEVIDRVRHKSLGADVG